MNTDYYALENRVLLHLNDCQHLPLYGEYVKKEGEGTNHLGLHLRYYLALRICWGGMDLRRHAQSCFVVVTPLWTHSPHLRHPLLHFFAFLWNQNILTENYLLAVRSTDPHWDPEIF